MAPSDLSSTENLSSTEVPSSTEALDDFAAQVPQPSLEGSMLESRTFAPKKSATLVQRLLTVVLPTALVPLLAAGGFEFFTVQRKSQQESLTALELESLLAAETTTNYLKDLEKLPETVTLSPLMQQQLRAAGEKAKEDGLHIEPIEEVEKKFASTKLFDKNDKLNKYLLDVARVEGFSEMFLTERHGFNIAFSHPTSDFVQRDESWWQIASQEDVYVGSPEFDESTGVTGITISQIIKDVDSDDFLGVIKSLVTTEDLEQRLLEINQGELSLAEGLQLWDVRSGDRVVTFTSSDGEPADNSDAAQGDGETPAVANAAPVGNEKIQTILDNETVQNISRALDKALINPDQPIEDVEASIENETGIVNSELELEVTRLSNPTGDPIFSALVRLDGHYVSIHTVPGTHWVAIDALREELINAEAYELLQVFALTTLILAIAATVVLNWLARRLAAPLNSLTEVAEAATDGQLDARAKLEGTIETQKLGAGFNTLLAQTQTLLKEQSESAAAQERQRQALENEIADLMEDVGDAAEGDLRVRAKLSEGDVGIVADLFNSVIENLRITTQQVKDSTGKVSTSLLANEATVLDLSAQAVEEAESLKDTMEAVEDIAKSIDEVAANATQASALTQDTFATVQAGTDSMDQTVESILGLRSTVGETAKKIKRLGESAQKISQAVSLIDEIALKTNLLAVNASVEAARAGEMGQGFTAVAEQVGSLAEQSAAATKEIAQIVSGIQTETQEVVEAIETGTAQVVDSTSLVEATKTRLAEVLLKSEQINQLMNQISASAQYQTESSAAVTDLVKEAAEGSAQRSQSSQQMAKSIQETAQIAKALEASVEQFKLED